MGLKTTLSQDEVEDLGIWQAATMDGYWDEKANRDIQIVYLKGQLQSAISIHLSYGNYGTKKRVATLRKKLKELQEQS